MPTSTRRGAVGLSLLEQDRFPPSYRPNDVFIGTTTFQGLGGELANLRLTGASATYPATNRALGFMFGLTDPFLVQKVWWVNGTTATTDNADVAVYTEDGATLLVAGGSTLIATANVVQEKDCTDTLLSGGQRYWCVYNQSGTTATPRCVPLAASDARMIGCAQFAGAVPLGSAFTPAAVAGAQFPVFGIAGRTQVA